jgi:hypothetical protein
MKALLLATVASLALATTANAASWTFGNLIISQISPENPTTFNNLPTGPTGFLENSTVCDSAYCGAIQLSSDGGVANGTTASAAEPAGDSTNYLWGVNGINPLGFNGAEVVFNPRGCKRVSELLQYLLGFYRRVDDEPRWDTSL